MHSLQEPISNTKMSSRGQVVIPANIRRALHWDDGTELAVVKNDDGSITIKKIPDALDWKKWAEGMPVENVEIDENGHYNPKKSPNFDDWMKNG